HRTPRLPGAPLPPYTTLFRSATPPAGSGSNCCVTTTPPRSSDCGSTRSPRWWCSSARWPTSCWPPRAGRPRRRSTTTDGCPVARPGTRRTPPRPAAHRRARTSPQATTRPPPGTHRRPRRSDGPGAGPRVAGPSPWQRAPSAPGVYTAEIQKPDRGGPSMSPDTPPSAGRGALPVSECVDAFVKLAGVDQGPQDVVGQVPEAQGDAAEVFEAAVDRFDGPVRQSGVEVGEDLVPSFP